MLLLLPRFVLLCINPLKISWNSHRLSLTCVSTASIWPKSFKNPTPRSPFLSKHVSGWSTFDITWESPSVSAISFSPVSACCRRPWTRIVFSRSSHFIPLLSDVSWSKNRPTARIRPVAHRSDSSPKRSNATIAFCTFARAAFTLKSSSSLNFSSFLPSLPRCAALVLLGCSFNRRSCLLFVFSLCNRAPSLKSSHILLGKSSITPNRCTLPVRHTRPPNTRSRASSALILLLGF